MKKQNLKQIFVKPKLTIVESSQNASSFRYNSFAYSIINSDNNLEIIKLLYNNIFGSEVNIIVKLNESNVEVKDSKMEDILKKNNVDYTKLD